MMDRYIELVLRGGQFRKLRDEAAKKYEKIYGLKRAELEILRFLSDSGEENTPSDIRKYLMMNKGYISQTMESLCQKQYINAVTDETDRRCVHYFLKDKAKDVISDLDKCRDKVKDILFEGFSKKEIECFEQSLRRLWNNMENSLGDRRLW